MLGVDDYTLTAGEFTKIDAMPGTPEPKLNSSMEKPLALQPFTDTRVHQKIDGSLLQHPGADAFLDAFAAGGLQNHRLDPVKMQQVGEHETSRAGSYDSDLSASFHEVRGSRTGLVSG